MSLIDGFTRQETLALTGTTSNRLQYLEKANLVIPQRVGKSRKPIVIYSWEQILEIRVIGHLRQNVSLGTVKKIVGFLDESGFDESLREKQLIVIDNEVFWIRQDWKDFPDKIPSIVQVGGKSSKDIGQYILLVIPILSDIVREVWQAAEQSEIIDLDSFKKRAKIEIQAS